jgi:SNF2 family DNA or RNA helicase
MLPDYEFKTASYKHQLASLERGWNLPGYGLLMEMGCGKSKVAIDNICLLRENQGLQRVLLIAPKGVVSNWPNKELPTHMPDRHHNEAIIHLWKGGHSETEKSALRVLTAPGEELRIFCINIEAVVASTKAGIFVQKFIAQGNCMLIVDESSTCKNPQALRTKKMFAFRKACKWRRILTGTPVTKSPLDLWSQFEILEEAALGFRSFFAFRREYAITEGKDFGGRRVDVVVGHRNTDELSKRVSKHASVVRKEDALDLPPKVYETREVELTSVQRRLYSDLRDFATAEIEAGRYTTATEVITQLLRLHQIVCGHVVDENGKSSEIPSNRLDVLVELLEEVQDRTIVWCSYRRDIDNVVSRLTKEGYKVVRYDGNTSEKDRVEAIYRFQGSAVDMVDGKVVGERVCPDSERADVFVGTPHAGGYGITLTAARAVVYFSNTYDLEKRLQSEDRAHRIGQTRSVLYVDLISKGTVDEKISDVLRKKENLANLIMDGPARIRALMG